MEEEAIVNFKVRTWRFVLRVLVLALIVAAVPLPAVAGQAGQPVAKPGLKASIQPIVRAVASTTAAPVRAAKTQTADPKAQLDSKSFFKTPLGAVAIAVAAAATGYALYSARHDRIPQNSNR